MQLVCQPHLPVDPSEGHSPDVQALLMLSRWRSCEEQLYATETADVQQILRMALSKVSQGKFLFHCGYYYIRS